MQPSLRFPAGELRPPAEMGGPLPPFSSAPALDSLPRSLRASASFAILPLALVLAFFGGACSWFAPSRNETPPINRRAVALRLKERVERTAGSEVWVKGNGLFSAERGNLPVVVLALPAGFDQALTAIRTEAEEEGLAARIQAPSSKANRRVAEIRLLRAGDSVGWWRLREVGEIYRAAIIIDDLGQDLESARKLIRLPYPFTFSILPDLPHSTQTGQEAHRAGREVMLHLPMQPQPGAPANPGPGGITTLMSSREVERAISSDLGTVPYCVGVNNHMGSRATADTKLMTELMEVLGKRGLYFIDSRTTAASVALDQARRAGVPAFFRSVFLDDRETADYTLGQLRAFRRRIEQQGVALAIGHPYPTTLAALADFLPQLERDDIQLVPASKLVRLPEARRLSPAPPVRTNPKVSRLPRVP